MAPELVYLVVLAGGLVVAMPGLVLLAYLWGERRREAAIVDMVPGMGRQSPLGRCASHLQMKWVFAGVLVVTLVSLTGTTLSLYALLTKDASSRPLGESAVALRLDAVTRLLDERLTPADRLDARLDRLEAAVRDAANPGTANGEPVQGRIVPASDRDGWRGFAVPVLALFAGIALTAFASSGFRNASPGYKALRLMAVSMGVALSFGGLVTLSMDALVRLDVQIPLEVNLNDASSPVEIRIDKLVGELTAPGSDTGGRLEIVATDVADIPPFPSGGSRLEDCSGVDALVAAMRDRQSQGQRLMLLVIMGNTDKRPLKPALKEIYGSNLGLGQQRAVFVADCLRKRGSASGGGRRYTLDLTQTSMVTLAGGPGHVGTEVTENELRKDRVGVVYAIWSGSSQPADDGALPQASVLSRQ